MVFRLGSARRSQSGGFGESGPDRLSDQPSSAAGRADPPADSDSSVLAEIDRLFVQAFALVGEGIAGATHALLAGDREAAKELVQRDEVVDKLTHDIASLA